MTLTYKDDIATLDPAIGYDWQNPSMMQALFDGLMDYKPGTFELVPGHAVRERPAVSGAIEVELGRRTWLFVGRELWTRPRGLPVPGPLGQSEDAEAHNCHAGRAGEPGREQRVRHLPHHFSVGGFRGQYCPAVLTRQVQGPLHSWLKANLNPPFLEHLSFRLGNQLFFIRIEDVDDKLEVPGSRDGIRAIADGCKGHACLMRPDLADRAVFLTLEPIPEECRRPEAELWAAFEAERPRILGVLLDAVAEGLKRLPETRSRGRVFRPAIWRHPSSPAVRPFQVVGSLD